MMNNAVNNMFPGDWENLEAIGKGGSSTVFKAVVKNTTEDAQHRYMAVKQIDVELLSKSQLDGIRAEIETMKSLSSTNIVQYYGMQETQYRIFIAMEYADCGSIRQFYNKNGKLFAQEAKYCLQHIVSGLSYLHDRGIAHRDVKCANCLLFSDGVVKLADFGASKRFESQSIVSGLKGTPHWMAPEVIKGTQMTDGWMKADVWSLGCTAVEMITGKVPYSEFENPMTAMYRIANGDIPKVHLQNEEMIEVTDIVAFVNLCCIVNAEERPSLGALKLHPILCTALQGVPTRLFDNPDLVDLSRFKTGGVVPTVTSKILNGDEAQISHVPTNRNAPEALMLPQDIQASSDSLESFPTPALYARKRIINFSSNCDSTDGLSLPKPTNTTNNTSITPTASSVFSPLPLSSQPATKQRYNNNNNSTTASTTNRVSASRESTAPSFSYVNIQPSEIGLELIQKSKFSQNIETNNELKPSNSNVSISFDEASVIYNQFMEKYQHNTGLNFPPPGAGAAHQPHSNYGSNSKTHEHRDYFVESREDDADVEQIYEDDFLCADPTEDEEEVKIMADHGDEDQQVVSRPNAPLTGEMLQLQLNSTGGKDKPKVSISGIRQVAKKELEELETNNNEMNRMKAKGKILPKLHKLQQPRIQNHQVAKRVKSNQKNNNLNDSLKGVRSFSAGTYLNNSGNQNLNESLKGRGKIETKHEASTSLPPLRPLLVLLEDASSNGHHLAPRYIQSAPAVSRSVNLPPITQHLTSATPNSKKLKSKMAKNG